MDSSDNFSSFEIKLEINELIIKDELATNTEIKMDPSMCSNFPLASSKLDNSFDSKLEIKVEQKEEVEAHLVQASSISDVDQADLVAFKYDKIDKEIELKQEELIIKEEPEEMEVLGSLEIIKYNTNPPTFGIRDSAANTKIKVDPAINRVKELLKICNCEVQVIRLPEQVFTSKMHRYLNLQDSLGQQFEEEEKDAKHKRGKHGEKNLKVYKRIRIGEELFECPTCIKCFTTKQINRHMLIHKNKRPFKCQQCEKKFTLKWNFKVHMLVHENKRPFNCQECDKGFNQNSQLKTHMLVHENKRPFKCSQCDKHFTLKCNLKAHLLCHENERPFNCQQCDKSFNRNSHLKSHMLTHEKKRPFKCSQCDKHFTLKCNLKAHLLCHENKRPFNCQQCDKSFNRNGHLKSHMLTHGNKRRFNCSQCDKHFTLKYNLKAHLLCHENKRPFNCQQCDKGFNRNSHLKSHMLTHRNKRPLKYQHVTDTLH